LEPPDTDHEPDELVPEPPLSMIRVLEVPLVPDEVDVFVEPVELVPLVEPVELVPLVEPVELVPLVEPVGTVYEISLE
jgi:hypothetical protein